jgi:hypothetical protein
MQNTLPLSSNASGDYLARGERGRRQQGGGSLAEASAAEYRWESSTARPMGCRVGSGAAEETPDQPGPERDRGCVHSSSVAEETPDERGGLGAAVGGARGEAGHKEELDGEEPAQAR